MLKENLYLEDLILHLSGMYPITDTTEVPALDKSDISLIQSFAKQIVRNLGFTDRQHELAKQKVYDYADTFSFLENLKDITDRTRIPLRQIDRSRWIRIEENDKGDFQIAIRFTFQKKLISSIEDIRRNIQDTGLYDKENKIHRFEYSEKNLYEIVKAFEGKNFELDELTSNIYNKLTALTADNHVPGVYDNTIKNLHPNGVKAIIDEIGEPSSDNLLLYKDRSLKYGLQVDGVVADDNSLAYKIAKRKVINLQVPSHTYRLDTLLLALEDLKRLPILILVPQESCYDSIVTIQEHLDNLISHKDISVMFRMDNQGEGIQFNEYLKQKQINNKVDSNTKIVYTLDSKVSKPLLNSGWNPQTVLVYGNNKIPGTRKVLECYTDNDLIIHYHDELIPTYHFYRREFELID